MKLKKMIDFLPDFLNKKEDSNFNKLLSIFNAEVSTFKENVERVDDWKSIDKAKGAALDAIGEQFGEYRGDFDDEFYRYMIKSKIAQKNMDGSTNKIIEIINQTLNVPLDQIKVVDLRNGPSDLNTIQSISIEGLPEEYFMSNKVSEKFVERISSAVAAGISLDRIFFDSINKTTLSIAVGTVVTENIVITHDINETNEFILNPLLSMGNVATTVESWSSDVKMDLEIENKTKDALGVVFYESVEIY